MVKAWIRKGKDKESEADIRNTESQKIIARIEVPKIVVNIGNPWGRVHGWIRAHMVLFNSNLGRPETGCSFDLEPDLKDERGEDSSLKSFCNKATLCFQYLTSENEVVGLQTLWKSSRYKGRRLVLEVVL